MNEMIMVRDSVNNHTRRGLVISLCLDTNPLISLIPPESPQILDIYSVVVQKCKGGNYSQPYFFKRNQSSDNRSHGFGAKFLLKKLSANDFSYERKSASNP